MFNLFTPPCFAAIGAMNSEIKSRKWFWGGIALQFATGFSVSFLVYQMGTLITEKRLGEAFVPGCIAITIIVLFIVMLNSIIKNILAGINTVFQKRALFAFFAVIFMGTFEAALVSGGTGLYVMSGAFIVLARYCPENENKLSESNFEGMNELTYGKFKKTSVDGARNI